MAESWLNSLCNDNIVIYVYEFFIGGLGSYTPSKVTAGLYQLGSYKENLVDTNTNAGRKATASDLKNSNKNEGDTIEDYLKPDTESTTWSNEIGAADILF